MRLLQTLLTSTGTTSDRANMPMKTNEREKKKFEKTKALKYRGLGSKVACPKKSKKRERNISLKINLHSGHCKRTCQFKHSLPGVQALAINLHDNVVILSNGNQISH